MKKDRTCQSVFAFAALLLAATAANAQTFANTGSISIPSQGAASPYPSTIQVSGLTATIESLTVSLFGLGHTWPDDIKVLLVGPGGETVLLMADAGGEFDISNVDLTFKDGAPPLPNDSLITSGTYRPTDHTGPDIFDPPAPSGPYGSALSVFANTDGNGTWRLFVFDEISPDAGSISGGWSMTVTQGVQPITYQGRLQDGGVPLNDTADFEFSLRDAVSGGNEIALATADSVQVVDGLFTVDLQFGAGAFGGDVRWVEIAVRSPAGAGVFTTLSPRQRITPAPEAIHARTAEAAATAEIALAAVAPLVIMGNFGTDPVGITQNAVGGSSTMELTTTDSTDNQATRILLRGAGDLVDIEFYTGASGSETKTMHIEGTNGNVGIGTTTPSTPLAIMGNGGTDPVGITQNAVGGSESMELTTTDSAGNQATRIVMRGGGDEADIQFCRGPSGSEIRTMHLEGLNGNVGIGTTFPTARLDVVGTTELNGHVTINSGLTINSNLTVNTDALSVNGATGNVAIRSNLTVNTDTLFVDGAAGNVGIGTTNPTEALHVCGNIRAVGDITAFGAIIAFTLGACPDYVFDTDYELMSLDELSKFIRRNKHLPNVPSAEAVERDGIDLGGFSMRLLEKTEELTLYLLDQNRRLNKKDAQVASLRGVNAELRKKSAELEQRLARLEAMLNVRSSQARGDAR